MSPLPPTASPGHDSAPRRARPVPATSQASGPPGTARHREPEALAPQAGAANHHTAVLPLPEPGTLLQNYHQLRRAAEVQQAARDAVGLVNVPVHDARHLDHRDAQTRQLWTELDAQMWQLRHQASIAWAAYAAAVRHAR